MREEEIKNAIEEEIMCRRKQSIEKAREKYEQDKDMYIEKFVETIDGMFKKSIALQGADSGEEIPNPEERKSKGKLTYIYINYVRSSIENGSCEYLIRMYDENIYYDTFEVEERFTTEYRLPIIKEDIEYFHKLIMKRILRAKKYEIKDFLWEYIEETYLKQIPEEIEDSIEKIKSLESYAQVQKDKNIAIYYGELMNQYDRKILI